MLNGLFWLGRGRVVVVMAAIVFFIFLISKEEMH